MNNIEIKKVENGNKVSFIYLIDGCFYQENQNSKTEKEAQRHAENKVKELNSKKIKK